MELFILLKVIYMVILKNINIHHKYIVLIVDIIIYKSLENVAFKIGNNNLIVLHIRRVDK